MTNFTREDFLLSSEFAELLYNNYASKLPIIDTLCRISAEDIAKNVGYSNISELWFSADNYKCRAMRAAGVDEKYITGNASDYEKFREYCRIMPALIGNPAYLLSHLELRRYFDCALVISEKNCDDIWKLTAEKLSGGDMGTRSIIEKSNCALLCTAEDPADSLEFHKQIADNESFSTVVLPAFCPDRGLNIGEAGISSYIERLGRANGVKITDLKSLVLAYEISIERFASQGCRTAVHDLVNFSTFVKPNEYQADLIFKKALSSDGKDITIEELMLFKSEMLYLLGKKYKALGWVMKLHLDRFEKSKREEPKFYEFERLVDYLVLNEAMPKTVIYSALSSACEKVSMLIDSLRKANDSATVIINGGVSGLNYNVNAIKSRISVLANLGAMGRYVGVFTDSESVVSFSGHEYFRRILCDKISSWAVEGGYPIEFDELPQLIFDICYNNAKKFFGFELN